MREIPNPSPALAACPKESSRFLLCLIVSGLVYVALAVGAGLLVYQVPLAAIPLGVVIVAGWLGGVIVSTVLAVHVRGNGMRVSGEQLPQVHGAVQEVARFFGLEAPQTYVVQFGRLRQTLVNHFLGSRMLVLPHALVEECGLAELKMFIGRQLAHMRLRHDTWQLVLMPSALLPLMYPAWRRATGYTADRWGLAACGSLEAARRAMFVEAAGGQLACKVNPAAYEAQVSRSGGFWTTLRHYIAADPAIAWRMAELTASLQRTEPAPAPVRSILATILCLPMPGLSAAGAGAAAVLPLIALAGAPLAFGYWNVRSRVSTVQAEAQVRMVLRTLHVYAADNRGRLPANQYELRRALEEYGGDSRDLICRTCGDEIRFRLPSPSGPRRLDQMRPYEVILIHDHYAGGRLVQILGYADGHTETSDYDDRGFSPTLVPEADSAEAIDERTAEPIMRPETPVREFER